MLNYIGPSVVGKNSLPNIFKMTMLFSFDVCFSFLLQNNPPQCCVDSNNTQHVFCSWICSLRRDWGGVACSDFFPLSSWAVRGLRPQPGLPELRPSPCGVRLSGWGGWAGRRKPYCFSWPNLWNPMGSFWPPLIHHKMSSGSEGKESPWNAGDLGLIPGSGWSPGKGNGNPLQCSCLENSMDRGAWRATVHGVAKESDATEWLTRSFLVTKILFSKSPRICLVFRKW